MTVNRESLPLQYMYHHELKLLILHELMLFHLSLSLSLSLSRTAVQEGGFSGKLDELEQATSFLHDNGTHTQLSVWLWRRFARSSLLSPLSLSQVSCSTMMTVSWTIFTLSIPSGSVPSWLMWSQCKRETHFRRTVRNVKMTTSVYQNSHTYFWSDHTHFYAGVQKYSTQDAVDRKILPLKYFHRGTGATKVKCPRINIPIRTTLRNCQVTEYFYRKNFPIYSDSVSKWTPFEQPTHLKWPHPL